MVDGCFPDLEGGEVAMYEVLQTIRAMMVIHVILVGPNPARDKVIPWGEPATVSWAGNMLNVCRAFNAVRWLFPAKVVVHCVAFIGDKHAKEFKEEILAAGGVPHLIVIPGRQRTVTYKVQ